MSFQRFGSAIGLGFFAAVLIVPTHKIAVAPGIVLAQATQPANTTTTKKAKTKVKEKKTGTTATQSPPSPMHVGPPDPGKY
jgi:hypothetical protein